ncbi:MAG: aminotransferase class I/II-fold pyridoxal phosphate-dependent enzyme [Rikenellaceae bacterium]|nr:aminotransferase class I/II-fold pyridoxal phosphate-dependent enzyme [Rikenellaceae bacterium]
MQAVILAAGMGRRLGELTGDNTKCMLEVNGVKLIDRALACLSELNLSRVVLVVGYKGENVKRYVGNNYKGMEVVYVDNPIYDKTNNIYSLYLAKEYLVAEDTLLLESDLIYEPAVLHRIVENDYPNLALVDKYESWMDGTVVLLNDEGKIKNFISKRDFKYSDIDHYYKTVNIYKFSKEFSATHYVPFLKAYCQALGRNEYYEQVLKVITLLDDSPLKALPLQGEQWYEIDDIQDLDIASGMFEESDEKRYKALTSRYGGYWRYPHMLDFCYLVNPYFPPTQMLDEIKASFETLLREYPSGMRVNSLLAAKNFSVKQEYIVVGNGAAELIKALIERHTSTLGVIYPTFEEYPNRSVRENIVSYIPTNADKHYSADDIIAFYADKEIETLLLINPDNPSGNYIPYGDLLRLIEWCKGRGVKFIVDESFVDFVDVEGEFSLLHNDLLGANPHLVVVKSISKSYGVPGLRLGVLASGDTALIAELKKEVAIWNINSFGEFYMQIYEKYHKDYLRACEQFREERKLFFEELQQIDFLRVIPSQANYFMCELVGERYTSHELAVKLLTQYNILIKDCSGKSAFDGGEYIRIAVRDRKDNHYLVESLKAL